MLDDWKKALRQLLLVVFVILLLKTVSSKPEWTDTWYVHGFYMITSVIQRFITRWLPFSLGDGLYAAAVLLLLVLFILWIRACIRQGRNGRFYLASMLRLFTRLGLVYILFLLCWGLNYTRTGIAGEMHLRPRIYSTKALAKLSDTLLARVNNARKQLGDSIYYPSFDSLSVQSVRAYHQAELKFPFLKYRQPSIKPSLYSEMLSYAGYTGYYNPFSGEAQVNVKVPAFYLPFICCHEMAHQLGYGDESEANFISYLVSMESDEPLFHYSAYYDLFNYANSELYQRDSLLARKNYRALDTLVKQDMANARAFFKKYRNKMEPVLKFIYGQYLKANNQPQGIETYEAVTAWLIAYGRISNL